jgi:hypothetical protein
VDRNSESGPLYWFEREHCDLVRRLMPTDKHLPGSFDFLPSQGDDGKP